MKSFARSLRLPGLLTLLGLGLSAHGMHAQLPTLELEAEAGPVWQTSNDVEIPNDGTATRFSLTELVGTGPAWTGRMYLTWHLTERSGLRLLYAPFSLTGRGTPSAPLDFAGADYAAGTPVDATYTFNSYRLSYRYLARTSERTKLWLGLTAKIRDATVALSQGPTRSRKDDVGFVPLLHLAGEWRPRTPVHVTLDADGLAGGPGRAIDASLKLGYDLAHRWSVRVGYRTVEGGADVEEVYSFAWLNYAVATVIWRW